MASLVGRSLGRYHLVEQLGEGGMATVYRAVDTRLERAVAVKVIRTDYGSDPSFLKRFERETKVLAQLNHPHIVHVLDAGDEAGVPYVVMDFVSGGTLRQRMRGPLPPAEAARLLAPIARALEYAHARGLVHRDVKPANVLLSADGQPQLSDFGIAKLLDPSNNQTGLTMTGVGIGTPDYMAPEQGLGQATPQSDIYSLGVIFYELVTGRRPYEAETPVAVMLKHLNDPLPRPRSLNPDLPEEVEAVILRALARQTEHRYATMADFAQALERLSSQPVADAAGGRRIGGPVWAVGLGVLALGACALIIGAGLLASRGLGAWPAPTPTILATPQPEVPTSQPAGDSVTADPTAIPLAASTATAPMAMATAAATVGGPTPVPDRSAGLPVSDRDGMVQVPVPAGRFVLGSRNEVVELDAFWIDQTEVTNAMYARCVAAGICAAPASVESNTRRFYFQNPDYDDYPVVFVSYEDAQTYCTWVGRRLPTGSEWEKAARGAEGRLYPWGDGAPDVTRANFNRMVDDTMPVGSYPLGAGPYGALDMAGNVSEWTDEVMDGVYRVARGGSYLTDASGLGSVLRYGLTPSRRFNDYGFRCATRSAPTGGTATPAAVAPPAGVTPAAPVISNFRTCDRPCTEFGAVTVATFPERTSQLYATWDYTGMQSGMSYTRTWSHSGVEWVRYDCTWLGPERGTFTVRLWDTEGLRSGTWTLTLTLAGTQTFTFNVPIAGTFDLFTPAGVRACPDWR
jgi:formylglycine-generating enzyme required for sulfatase activity